MYYVITYPAQYPGKYWTGKSGEGSYTSNLEWAKKYTEAEKNKMSIWSKCEWKKVLEATDFVEYRPAKRKIRI